jgi:DNA repair protein RecO (recombination protein O)
MSQKNHRVTLQKAFILHGRDYRDSSRLLDVFSLDYGRVSLLAKGTRSPRSKLQGILEPFSPLILSWSGKGDLQTLTAAESVKNSIALSGKQIISAYYINELLQRLMTQYDPHPELFLLYYQALEDFKEGNEELVLRRFEKNLLAEIGYALNLVTDANNGAAISKDEIYYYDIESGPVNIKNSSITDAFTVSGQTLLDMSTESYSHPQNQKESKQLMRIILSHYLGDKPLKTRNLHWYKTL